jgi:hypothetical protein
LVDDVQFQVSVDAVGGFGRDLLSKCLGAGAELADVIASNEERNDRLFMAQPLPYNYLPTGTMRSKAFPAGTCNQRSILRHPACCFIVALSVASQLRKSSGRACMR